RCRGFPHFSEMYTADLQLLMADGQARIAEEERVQRKAEDEVARRAGRRYGRNAAQRRNTVRSAPIAEEVEGESEPQPVDSAAEPPASEEAPAAESEAMTEAAGHSAESPSLGPVESQEEATEQPPQELGHAAEPQTSFAPEGEPPPADSGEAVAHHEGQPEVSDSPELAAGQIEDPDLPRENEPAETPQAAENGGAENGEDEEVVESVGGDDALEEATDRMPRIRRQYKIQEVIKRRQIMLVQVVKEERGTKGAALTTYLSLAGRYSVLMPNTARGGGISRKITSAQDRKRLKEVAQELEVPEGMGVILRTAGANRTKAEIKRDFEYLLRVWETVR